MNVGNSYEVFFLAISLLFCVCKLPVFYQGEAKSMAKWFSTEEFPSICWGVKTYIDQCECLDYCLLVLTLRSSLSLGKLQSTMALSDPRLGSRLLSLFSIWQAPTNWELISFKDDGSDYPQVHWIYLCYQFQNVNHGQGLRCFFIKQRLVLTGTGIEYCWYPVNVYQQTIHLIPVVVHEHCWFDFLLNVKKTANSENLPLYHRRIIKVFSCRHFLRYFST